MKFLFKEIKQKPVEYIALGLIFVIALGMFLLFRSDSHDQRRVVYAASAAYFGWSLYHHYRRGDLETSIIIEYLVFILLVLVVVSTTLF